MSKAASLTDQRAKLADADSEAQDALTAATHRLRTGRSDAGREVVTPLIEFTEAIRNNLPDATPEAERADRKRELIREFFDAIEERRLTLDPVRSNEGFALAVTDPSIDAEYDDALRAKNGTAAAIREFDRDHGDQLQAERDKADAAAIREALAGDDPEAIRAALERREESHRSARQATADKLVSGEYEGWEDDANRHTTTAPANPAALTTAD